MTPDEHYQLAEHLLETYRNGAKMLQDAMKAERDIINREGGERTLSRLLAEAQVHATLATLGTREGK